jgi:hypothetical protein
MPLCITFLVPIFRVIDFGSGECFSVWGKEGKNGLHLHVNTESRGYVKLPFLEPQMVSVVNVYVFWDVDGGVCDRPAVCGL